MTTPAVVNSATATGTTGTTLAVVLDAVPTAGNLLVIAVAERKDGGDTISFSQGTWTQVQSTAYSGSSTNWPHWMYYMVATASMSATTTVTFGGTGATKEINIVEISDANTLDTSIRASNTSTCTGSLTPTASQAIALVSNVYARTDATPFNLTPATGMTELENNQRCALNSRMIASASGSYTVGSTGNGANSSMLGAAFKYVAPPSGTAASSFGFSTAATGTESIPGTAASSFGFSTAGTGEQQAGAEGTAASSFGFSTEGAATVVTPVNGSAASSFGFSTAGTGTSLQEGADLLGIVTITTTTGSPTDATTYGSPSDTSPYGVITISAPYAEVT